MACECEVCGSLGNDEWSVSRGAGKELRGYVGHGAGNCVGGFEVRGEREAEVAEEFGEDLRAGAGCHGFVDEVSGCSGGEAVAPEDLDGLGLGAEVRLVRDDDGEEPVAVGECGEGAGAGSVFGEGFEVG